MDSKESLLLALSIDAEHLFVSVSPHGAILVDLASVS
jgi:hypothetical protein